MFGKLTWDAIPFDEPIPLITSLVVILGIVGIGIWVWLLLRAMKGQFGPQYFGPIDFAALYWHLVDLIWIYLFPLLYLIH